MQQRPAKRRENELDLPEGPRRTKDVRFVDGKRGVYQCRFEPGKATLANDARVNEAYDHLVGKLVLGRDRKLLRALVADRHDKLRPQTLDHIQLLDERGSAILGALQINKIVWEEGQEATNWWVGKVIDNYNFARLVKEFEAYMQGATRIRNVVTIRWPSITQPAKVSDVLHEYSYAR